MSQLRLLLTAKIKLKELAPGGKLRILVCPFHRVHQSCRRNRHKQRQECGHKHDDGSLGPGLLFRRYRFVQLLYDECISRFINSRCLVLFGLCLDRPRAG